MASNDNSTWLYRELTKRGYNLGTEEEYNKGLENPSNREWLYNTASASGINMGGMDEFNKAMGYGEPKSDIRTVGLEYNADSAKAVPVTPQEAEQPATSIADDYEASANGGIITRGGQPILGQNGQPLNYIPKAQRTGNAARSMSPDSIQAIKESEALDSDYVNSEEYKQQQEEEKQRRQQMEEQYGDVARETKKEANKRRWEALAEGVAYRALAAGAGTPEEKTSYAREAVAASKEASENKLVADLLGEAIDYMEQSSRRDEPGADWNLTNGVWDAASRLSTWDMGYSSAVNGLTMKRLADKAENDPENLTETEQKVLDAVGLSQAMNEAFQSNAGIWYNVGVSLPESAGFMASMALNPASGLGRKAAERAVAKYGKEYVEMAAKNAVRDMAEKSGKAAVKAAAARTLGDTAEMGIMTLTTGLGRTVGSVLERLNGTPTYTDENGYIQYTGQAEQEEIGEALAKGFGSQFIENWTEAAGEYFAPLGKMMGAAANTGLRKVGLNKMADYFQGIKSSQWSEMMRNFMDRTKFNGVLGEIMEEELGSALDATFVGDTTWKKYDEEGKYNENWIFDKDNQLTTILSCAIMSGTLYGVQFAGNKAKEHEINRAVDVANNTAAREFGSSWDGWRERIEQSNPEEMESILKDAMYDTNMTVEQRQALADFASKTLMSQSFYAKSEEALTELSETERDIRAAYGAGYSALPNNFRDIRMESERAADNLEKRGLLQTADEMMANPDRAEYLNSLGAEDRQAVEDYWGKKSRENGLYDGLEERKNVAVDEWEKDLIPAIHQEVNADGVTEDMVTTAQYDGRNVYVLQDDGTTSVILGMDGEKRMVKSGDLSEQNTSTLYDLTEAYKQMYGEQLDAENNFLLSHNAQTKMPEAGLVIDDGTAPIIVTEAGNGWATVSEAMTDEAGNIVPKPDGQSRDVTTGWILARQDAIYDRRDEMAREEQLRQDAERRDAAAMEEQKQRGIYQGAVFNDGVTNWRVGAYDGSSYTVQSEDGQTKVMTYDEVKNMLEPSVQQVAQTAQPTQEVEPGTMFTYVNGEKAKAISKNEDGTWNVETDSGRTDTMPENYIQRTFVSAPEAAKQTEPAAMPGAAEAGTTTQAEEKQQAPAAPTALSQIAPVTDKKGKVITDENGNPEDYQWETVEPSIALAGMREAGYDDIDIRDVANNNVESLAKEVSKASKKLSDAKTLIDKRKAREALNTANTRMGWWKDITAAMRPKEVGVKKDIATQNDETVTGIEDIQRRFADGKRIAGRAETQTLQNGEEVSGHYELVEAGTVTPSHDFETFSSTKGFPTTAEGANINDRDYEHDEAAQTSVRNRASSYDKRAYQEPVFVSPDGIVYSGNDRTMSGMLAANQGTDTKYNASLREDASKFGFTPEQVDEFKHPRLVFVTDERLPYTTETMAKFNVPSGKTQNVTERKVKAAKTTSDETFAKIVELIGDSKMDDFYMFHGAEAIKLLQDRGIIQQNEVAALMNGTKLSDQGVELIETILIGKIFEDNTNAIRMFDAEGMGNVRKAIGYAVPELIKNKTLGEYSVMGYIAEMVEICYNAHEQGSIVSDYIGQSNLFDENPSEKYTNFAKVFAKEADRGTLFLRNTLSIFNNSAADEVGTESMFGKRTREDILNELLNWSNNNNGRESGTEETDNASAGSEASGAGDRIGSVRGGTDNEGGDERADLGRDSGPDGSTDEGSSPVLEEKQPQLEPAEEFGDNPAETGLQDGRTWAEGESADAISDKVEEIENTISEITSSGNELTQDEKDYIAWGGGFIQSVQLAQQEAANSSIAPLYDIKDAPKPDGIKRAQRESLFSEGRRAFVKAHNSVPTIQLGENREELTFEKFADAYRNRVGEYTYSKDEPFLRPFYDYFIGKLNEEADRRAQAVEDEKAKRRAKRQQRQNQQDLSDAMVSHMEDMGINVTTDLDEKRAATKEWKAMFDEDGAFHGTDADKLKKLQDSEGSYGFVYRGRIYLDPRRMRPEAALHEYSHLWSEALRRANPDEWNNVVDILKNDTDTWDIVRSQYPELTNDNDIADEVLATYSGARGARRLAAEQQRLMSRQGITESERSKYNNIFANIRKAIQDFWKSVASFLGIRYESEEQIADQILKDFVDGVNPIAELKRRISLSDREYIEAATNGDLNRATELFNEALQVAIGNGVVPYMPWTDNYSTVQRDAHLVKLGDTDAIERTARRLAPMIPSNAVLIPMPGRTGRATDMLTLAEAISKLTGNEVKDILRGKERESQRNAKLSGQGLTAGELAMTATEEVPVGMVPVFIDNVVDTGATAEAAVKAVGRGVVIVLASTKGNYKHASHIKNASPVVYANGSIVPLSERFDVARQDVRFMKGGLLDMLDTSTENDELIKRYNDALEAITDESNEIGGMMYDSTDGAAVEEKRIKVSKLARQLFDELNIDLDAIRRNSIYGNGITEPIDKFGRMLVGDAADALSELEEAISNEIDRLEQVDIPDAEVESQKNQVPDENAQRKADAISAAREEILNTVYATYEDRVDWDEEHTEDEMRDIIRLVTDDIVDDYMESADDDVRSLVSDADVSSMKDDAYKEAIGMYEDRRSEAFKDGYSAGMFEGGFNNEEDYTSWLKEYGEDPELLFEDAMGGDSSKYGHNISIRDYVRGHIQAIWERYLAEYPNAYGMPIMEAKPVDMAKEDDFYQLADLLDDALSHILDFDKLEAANDFYMNLLNQFNDLEHIIPKNIQTIKSEVGRYRSYTYLITEQYNKMAKRRAAERKLYRIGKSGLIRLKNRVKKDMENVKEPVFGERLVKASMGRKAAIKALAENNGLKIVFIPINGLYPYTSALHYSGYTEGNTIVVNRFGLNPGNRAIGAIVKKLAKKDGVYMEDLSERMYPDFFNESEKAVEYLTSRGLSWTEARNEYYRREADPTIAAIFDSEVFAARAANVATDEEVSFIDGMFERLSKIDAKGYSKDVAKARAAFNEAINDRREKNESKNVSVNEDGNGVEFSVAYHGTKADFNVFDNAHMGEGEGAQVHGYGTYVAFDKSVGEGYARRIGQFGLTYEGIYPITTSYERAIVNDIIREAQGNETRDNIQAIIDRKKKQWKEAIASGKEWAEDAPKWLDFINNIDASDFEMKQERHLYIVDVPDDNGHNYLPEGKTIAKSDRKRIADVVRRIDNAELQRENHGSNWMPNGTESVANGIENNTIDAVEVRERLVDAFGSEKRASEIMSQAGFTGIKYDGNWDGECAVIFNADDIKIIEKTRFSIPNDNQSTFTNDTYAKKLATMAELYALGDDVVYVSQEEADALAKDKAAERMAQNKKRALETASVISEETHQPTVVSSAAGAKVLQNLGNAKEYYENLSNNTKDFIGNLSSAIGAENKGSDSQYATFETANGRIVTIRIANHNAKVSNFDKRGESEGISIVISAKKNKGAVNDGSAHLVEYFYDAIKLRRAEGKPLVSIIQSIEQSLYSGEYKDSTGLAEVQDLNGTDYELRRTDGTVYGYKLNGKIYLSPKGINPNTPVHEYTHLWATAMSKYAPEQWANIVRLLKGTEVWDEVLADENYSDLKDDDAVASEVLARISGKNNAEKLIAEAEKVISDSKDTYEVAAKVTLINRIKQALNDFWNWVGQNLFGIEFTSVEQVTDRVLWDMLNHTNFEVEANEAGIETIKHQGRAPKKTGKGYKLFVVKDGKLYPPMVANKGGKATPVGVWLDAEAADPIDKDDVDRKYADVDQRMRRYHVKAGGKGTQGSSGKLAYRPGWHLGTIPYALQFLRKDGSFPGNFVWAEVEYSMDNDYQSESDERMMYDGKGKKFKSPSHAFGGLNHIPENGYYMYRTNPNPKTDPWVITGSMKVVRILTPTEVDDMVRKAGREPQKRQDGHITDQQVEELNKNLFAEDTAEFFIEKVPVIQKRQIERAVEMKRSVMQGQPLFREESEPSERKRKFDELKDKHGEDTVLIFQGDNDRFIVYDDDVDYLLRNKANIAKRRARGGFAKAASIEGNVSDVVGSIISNGRRTILFESYYDDRNKRIEGNEEVDRYPSMFVPNPTEEEMDDIIRRGASVIQETPRAYALEAVDKGDTPLSIENIGYYIYKNFGRYQRRIFNETRGVYRVYDSENPANGIIVRETESGYYKMDRNMLKAKLPAIEDAMDAYANKLYALLDLDEEYVSESAKDIIEEDLADLNYARKFYRDLAEGRQEWRTAMWPRFRWIGEIGAQQLQDSGLMAYESIIRDRGAAETMEKAGKTAKEIKIATGWERGADGKWRYEMRDLKVKDEFAEPFNEYDELKKQKENLQSQIKELEGLFNRYFNVLSEKQLRDILDQAANKRYEANEVEKSATTFAYKNHRLSDVIDDKELFDTYPQLNDVFVSFHPNIKGGGVDSNSHHITVGTELSPREVLIHEIQHIIQDIEGFAEGGNVHTLDDVIEEAQLTQNDVYRIKEDSGFYDFIIKCIENPETEEEKLVNKRLNERDFDSVDYYMNNVADSQTREDWEKANKRLDAMKQSFGSLISSVDVSTYDAYHRLAGEVEARNAENRRDMTEEQRRTTPMVETEDVPRDEQLFTYGNTAEQLARALNVDVEVVSSRDELSEDMKREIGNRRVKGWYNPTTGGVSVFLPNATSDNDIKRTILHEIVGHKGLRELVGSNNYDDWMLDLFNNLPKNVRDRVLERAKFKEWDIPYTMDEFLAEQAEREYTPTWWQKVKGAIRNMLRFVGVDVELTDADVKYLLWRSRRHLEGDDIFDMAMNAIIKGRAKRSRGRYNTTASMRYRSEENMEDFTEEELEPLERRMGTVAAEYDDALRKASYKFQESYQDSMLGLKKFMEIAAKRTGKPITDAENAYMYENEMTSRNQAHYEEWKQQFFVPLEKAFLALKKAGASEKTIINYMIAKHGLERNEIFARRDAKYQFERYKEEHPKTRKTEDDFFYKNREKDYSGLTGLTGEADVAAAEEAAREYVAGFEAKYGNELTGQLWEKTNAATKATLENSYMAGIIDQERYEQIRDEFEYYIPLRGWEQTTADEVYDYLNSNDGPYNAPIKVAKGRWSVADNPIATIGNMAISGIVEANRNRLKQRFLTFVTNHKTDGASVGDLWVKRVANETDGTEQWVAVFPDITSDMLNAAQVMKLTQQFDEHMQKLAAKDPASYMRVSEKHHIPFKIKTGDLKEHQVIVKKNGVPVVITINGNPRAAQAINGKTNPETVDNPFVKLTNTLNRFLSANVTTRNPAFVTANLMRDMFYSNTSAWIKESPAYAAAYNRNWAKVITKIGGCIRRYKLGTLDMSNPMDKMFADFIHNGGETGYTVIKDVEDYKKIIEKDMKNFNAKTLSVRWIRSHLGDALDTFGRWAEGTSRFAAYVTSVEMGRSVDKSIHDAKEISVNFNKKGSGSRTGGKWESGNRLHYLSSWGSQTGRGLYVFWNAGVQGLTNFGRMAVNKQTAAKSLTAAALYFCMGAAVPMMASAGGDDDDEEMMSDEELRRKRQRDYYNLPKYVRRNNICFRAGNMWVTIPLPIELRAFYGLGELAYGSLSGKENNVGKEVVEQVSQIMPIDMMEGAGGLSAFVPSSVKPFYEVGQNVDWTGKPLYKKHEYNEDMPNWTKAYKSTSPMLIRVSRALNEVTGGTDATKGYIDINPASVEHIFEGYLGGVATMTEQASKSVQMIWNEDLRDWRNVPVASRFLKSGNADAWQYAVNNMYFVNKEHVDGVTQAVNKYKKALGVEGLSEREKAKNEKWLNNVITSEDYRRCLQWKEMDKQMNKLNKAYKERPSKELEKQMLELKAQMNAIFEEED